MVKCPQVLVGPGFLLLSGAFASFWMVFSHSENTVLQEGFVWWHVAVGLLVASVINVIGINLYGNMFLMKDVNT